MDYVIKPEYEGDVRRITLKPSEASVLSFAEVEERIRKAFTLPVLIKLKLTYKDKDGEVVTIGDDLDLEEAFITQAINPLHLKVATVASASTPCLQETKATEKELSNKAGDDSTVSKYLSRVCQLDESWNRRYSEVVLDHTPTPVISKTKGPEKTVSRDDSTTAKAAPEIDTYDMCYMCDMRPIVGPKYKSTIKFGYDLCGSCYEKEKGLALPLKRLPTAEKPGPVIVITCDKCFTKPTVGPIYTSLKNINYDLCSKCYQNEKAGPNEYKRISQGSPHDFDQAKLEIHEGVTCDMCLKDPIKGSRYKSLTKFNYDLCGNCFHKKEENLDPTKYKRIPLSISPCYKQEEIHVGVTCDVCFMKPIKGSRYKSTTKLNYDLCENCFRKKEENLDSSKYKRVLVGALPHPDIQEIHEGVTCDMCFTTPIRGSRYKSTTKLNYDLCRDCFHDHEHLDPTKYKRIPLGTLPRYEKQEIHYGVSCDICLMKPIKGARFKSLTKVNYDLCRNCLHQKKANLNPTRYKRICLVTTQISARKPSN